MLMKRVRKVKLLLASTKQWKQYKYKLVDAFIPNNQKRWKNPPNYGKETKRTECAQFELEKKGKKKGAFLEQ
jgi:hypothetical protein